jgi:hypothetical protein
MKPNTDKTTETGSVEEQVSSTNLETRKEQGAAAAAPAREELSEFQTWWKETTSQKGKVLEPGIYDVQEPNEYFVDRLANESLEGAKEFIGENADYVIAMVPSSQDDTYVILSQRPATFEGEVHGHREGVLLLADCPDNVLFVAPIRSTPKGEDQPIADGQ